jgi:hypothetical protein
LLVPFPTLHLYGNHACLLSKSHNYTKASLPSELCVNVTTHGGFFSIAAKQDFHLPLLGNRGEPAANEWEQI